MAPDAPISPLALLGGLGMLAVGLGFTAWVFYRGLGWRYFLLGSLTWVVSGAIKFAWAIALNSPVKQALVETLPQRLAGPAYYIFLGLLAGLFEVGVVWVLLKATRMGRASVASAQAFGFGFGAIEALLLGAATSLSVGIALLHPDKLSPEGLSRLAMLNNVFLGIAPIWERFFTAWQHVLVCVLVCYAIVAKKPGWILVAGLYKSSIDTVTAYAQLSFLAGLAADQALLRVAIVEGVVAAWGIVGWLATGWICRRYPVDVGPDTDAMQASAEGAASATLAGDR